MTSLLLALILSLQAPGGTLPTSSVRAAHVLPTSTVRAAHVLPEMQRLDNLLPRNDRAQYC
jgi:hypothetical protein